jgi:hypothetical protein
MKKETLRRIAMTALPILLAGLLLLPTDLARLDPLTNIRHIGNNNDQLNTVNDSIAAQMQDISHLADTTQKIAGHLHTLQKGLDAPAASLRHLDRLSTREVELSQQFVGLATRLQTDLTVIGNSSSTQQTTLQAMHQSTADLAFSAGNLATVNETMAAKLDRAAVLTQQVEQSMP